MTIKEVKEDYETLRSSINDVTVLQTSYIPQIKRERYNEKIIELNAVIQFIKDKYAQLIGYRDDCRNTELSDVFRFICTLDSEEDTQTHEEAELPTEIKLEIGKRYIVHNLYDISDPEKPSVCQKILIHKISPNGKAVCINDYDAGQIEYAWVLIEKLNVVDCLD